MRIKLESSFFKALLLTLGLLTACSTQKPAEIEAATELSETFILETRKHPDTMKIRMLDAFDSYAKDGKVHHETILRLTQIQHARKRSEIIGNFYRLDLDGDGDISPIELVGLSDSNIASWSSRQGKRSDYAKADTDKDSWVTPQEIQAFAKSTANPKDRNSFKNPILYLMAFDANGDGILNRAEFNDRFDETFSDYMILKSDQSNETPTEKLKREKEDASRIETCTPDILPSKTSDIILVSGYGGAGQSSVAVTGMDEKTDLGRISIEGGTTPVYIIASSVNPMVWSIEGATSRVEGFVSTRAHRNKLGWGGVGVVGLPKDKIAFTSFECIGHIKSNRSKPAILAKSMFEKIFNRPLKNIVSVHYFDPVSLPSGDPIFSEKIRRSEYEAARNGVEDFRADNGIIIPIRNKLQKNKSAHLRKVANENLHVILPGSVISPGKTETYDIFPNHTGLMQLVEQGKLELLDDGTFLIREEIPRFPAGLTGDNRANFILKTGVPFPEGSLGRSSVVSEDTGECLAGPC